MICWEDNINQMKVTQFVVLSLLFLFVVASNDITLAKLRTATLLSYAAYCDSVTNWSCFWCKQTSPITVTAKIYDKKTDTFGYVGHTSTHSKLSLYNFFTSPVVIAFRGTVSLENFITNLKSAVRRKFPKIPGAEVAIGFDDAYNSVREQVISAVNKLKPRFNKIYITGLSLGCALSTMCATDLHFLGFKDIEMIGLGCPRVGNQAFAKYFHTVSLRVI